MGNECQYTQVGSGEEWDVLALQLLLGQKIVISIGKSGGGAPKKETMWCGIDEMHNMRYKNWLKISWLILLIKKFQIAKNARMLISQLLFYCYEGDTMTKVPYKRTYLSG